MVSCEPAIGPVNRPLCPPRWAAAVRVLVEDVVTKNAGMFVHFHEIDLEDVKTEAELAGCRSWGKYDPRRASPSRFIRRVSKCRLIDLWRRATLKHKRDRDYAPRQQFRSTDNQLAFTRRLYRWIRESEDQGLAGIDGDIFALLALRRLLGRYCCRFEPIPTWKRLSPKFRGRLCKLQYDQVAARLREGLSRFCGDDVSLISQSVMDHDTASAHSSLYASE